MPNMFYMPFRPAFDSAGVSVPSAQAYFTVEGTNTPSAPYVNAGLTNHRTNPVVADGAGKFPTTFLDPAVSYRVRIYSRGAEVGVDTPLEEFDPYVPGFFADAAALEPVADAAAESATAAANSAATATSAAGEAAASVDEAAAYLASLTTLPTQGLGVTAASRVALSILPTTAPAILTESGREGVFVFDSSNLSAAVTADPGQVMYVAPTSAPTGASGAWVRENPPYLTPEMAGAVGDGVTNDFTALRNLVSVVNFLGGGTVRFGRGKTYYQSRYFGDGLSPTVTSGGTTLTTGWLRFASCDGLVIEGNGAVLAVNGTMNRTGSSIASLGGLYFFECKRVVVRNLELNGNVQNSTKNVGVTESGIPYGLFVAGGSDVIIENVYSHHWQTDGFGIDKGTTLTDSTTVALAVTLTSASSTASVSSTASIKVGDRITGLTGVDAAAVGDTVVLAIIDGTTFTLGRNGSAYAAAASGTAAGATFVRGRRQAARRITMRNCRAEFNARQGMTIAGLRGGLFEECSFNYTGFVSRSVDGTSPGLFFGSYGGHSPQAGMDFEPDISDLNGQSGSLQDIRSGEALFNRCRFVGNAGCAMLANKFTASHSYVQESHFNACHFEVPAAGGDYAASSLDGLIFDVDGGSISNSALIMRDKYLQLGATGSASSYKFLNNFVSGYNSANSAYMVQTRSGSAQSDRLVQGNTFIGLYSAAKAGTDTYFWRWEDTTMRLVRNRFFSPTAAYASNAATVADPGMMRVAVVTTAEADGNRWETDLPVSGTQHFTVTYGSGNYANERFKGASQGTGDTIRPGKATGGTATDFAYGHDTNQAFSSKIRLGNKTQDWASLANGAQQSTTVTVTDAVVGDRAEAWMDVSLGGTRLWADVTAANTVTVYQRNDTGGAVDVASGNLYASVTRRTA